MKRVRGRWQQGRVVLDEPIDWAEGCRVWIEPESLDAPSNDAGDDDQPSEADPLRDIQFMTEAEQGSDPESIARWVEGCRFSSSRSDLR